MNNIPVPFLRKVRDHKETYKNSVLDILYRRRNLPICVKSCFIDLIILHQILFSENHIVNIRAILCLQRIQAPSISDRDIHILNVDTRIITAEDACLGLSKDVWSIQNMFPPRKRVMLSFDTYNTYLLKSFSRERIEYFALWALVSEWYVEHEHENTATEKYGPYRSEMDYSVLKKISKENLHLRLMDFYDRVETYTKLKHIYGSDIKHLLCNTEVYKVDDRNRVIKCLLYSHYVKQADSLLSFILARCVPGVLFPTIYDFVEAIIREYIFDNFDGIFSCIENEINK